MACGRTASVQLMKVLQRQCSPRIWQLEDVVCRVSQKSHKRWWTWFLPEWDKHAQIWTFSLWHQKTDSVSDTVLLIIKNCSMKASNQIKKRLWCFTGQIIESTTVLWFPISSFVFVNLCCELMGPSVTALLVYLPWLAYILHVGSCSIACKMVDLI